MKVSFECAIKGTEVHCVLVSNDLIKEPVLCCSLMAPFVVLSGGTMVASTGGFAEIALADLKPNQPVTLVLQHAIARHKPANRAWLPLGPYLRHAGGLVRLPVGPSGAADWVAPETAKLPDLRLSPPPSKWEPSSETVSISGFSCEDDQFSRVDALAARNNLGKFLTEEGHPVLVKPSQTLGPEAYELGITADEVTLTAGDAAGTFYGAVSLLHLLHTHGGELPLGSIKDSPEFGWRGMHLDCARHFFQPQTILAYVDLLALMKMNRFHWHFADDEAFRLELETVPEIWQKTKTRGEGQLIPAVFGGGIEASGSYSLEFVRQLVEHASNLHVQVMPEVEFPAHALALNAAIDGLRDPADNGGEVSVQGYKQNSINPAMPKTWELTEAIITELAELFPFEYIHLGCDELPDHTWAGSPAVAALKVQEGLETTDDVQGWMMEKLGRFTVGLGKKPAAWEEAARGKNGGIGNDALLFSWTGQGAGIEAVKRGYDIVMCPAQNAYLDMAHSDDPQDWGANWAAYLPLRATTAWVPVPDEITDYSTRILGVQGCFWGEFTTRDWELANMIWPRILGVAQSGWGKNDPADGGAQIEGLAAAYAPTAFAKLLPR